MCDDSNSLEAKGESATAQNVDQLHASPACKNPNCPNRHRCPAAAQLSEVKPVASTVPLDTE